MNVVHLPGKVRDLAVARAVDKLAAIAALVGYTSEFAFAKAFKRAFGISPGSFRNANRETTIRAAA